MPNNNAKRSGFAVVLGMSSAGKSSLLNSLIEQKVAITTSKKQSTRTPMRAIYTCPGRGQIVFIDTPGFFKPKDKLEEYMLHSMINSIAMADLILFVADISAPPNSIPMEFIDMVIRAPQPKILVISKTDKKHEFKISDNIELVNLSTYFQRAIPVSALSRINTDRLIDAVFSYLPEGAALYPEDEITDANSRFIVTEIIREAVFDITHEEVPYSVAVYCEQLEERSNGVFYISCIIYVERDSQKGIIIGNKGLTIKKIGVRSRQIIQEALEINCHLDLKVKVAEKWRRDERFLRMFGYHAPGGKRKT